MVPGGSFLTRDTSDASNFAHSLQDCTDFNFQEVQREDAARMSRPRKLYDGRSGLKRTVAASFDTPLGAFQKAGFNEELVLHYTRNSNK